LKEGRKWGRTASAGPSRNEPPGENPKPKKPTGQSGGENTIAKGEATQPRGHFLRGTRKKKATKG